MQTFQAKAIERYTFGPQSIQVTKIKDSAVVEANDPPDVTPTRASVHVYVHVDAVYEKVLELGATSLAEQDKPRDERSSGVKDSFGNGWWLATKKE